MIELEELVSIVISDPTPENKLKFEDYILTLEYELIKQDKLSDAYTARSRCATIMLREWIKVYKTTENCPVSYQDTLNIPFRLEKNKYLKS